MTFPLIAQLRRLLLLAALTQASLWADVFQAPRLWERLTTNSFGWGPERTIHDGQGSLFPHYMPIDWVNGKQVGGPIKLVEATGTPDPTFQPGPLELSPSAVAVQPDGKAVFSGTRERCAYIARLNPDGSLDPTFRVFELSMNARFLTVLADGAILATIFGNQRSDVAPGAYPITSPTLIRLRADGRLDASFKAPELGTIIWTPPVLDAQGRICFSVGSARGEVVRLFPDGRKDPDFPVASSFPSEWGGSLRGLALQSDGKLVIVGNILLPRTLPANVPAADRQTNRFAAIRLDAAGRFDPTFKMVPLSLLGLGDYPRMLVQQPDDKFVVAAAGLHRFNADGTLDPTFKRYRPTNYNNFWLSRSPDGHLFTRGDAETGLLAFDRDGNPAPEFAVQGFGSTMNPRSFALLGEGRVALAGNFNRTDAIRQSLVTFLNRAGGTISPAQPNLAQLLGADLVSPTYLNERVQVLPAQDGMAYFVGEAAQGDELENSGAAGFALRLRADGTADASFQANPEWVATKPTYLTDAANRLWFFRSSEQAAVDWWFNSTDGVALTNWVWFGRLDTNGALAPEFQTAPPAAVAELFNQFSAVKLKADGEIDQLILGELRPLVARRAGGVLVSAVTTNGTARLVKLNGLGAIEASFSPPAVGSGTSFLDFSGVFNPRTGVVTYPYNGVEHFTSRVFQSATELPDGRVLVAGDFTELGGVPVRGLALLGLDGAVLRAPLPALALLDLPFPSDRVRIFGLTSDDQGRAYVAGIFDRVDGAPAKGIIRLHSDGSWDRSFVSPLELVDYPTATAQLQLDGDTLWAGGSFRRLGERFPRPLWRLSLTVPQLLAQLAGQATALGGTARFEAVASGSGPLRYQWQFNGADLGGKTNASLELTQLASSAAGRYRVRVSNPDGEIISEEAVLTVGPTQSKTQQITWLQPPAEPPLPANATYELTATASSGLPVAFTVVSGPAVVDGRTLRPTGAGLVVLRAEQAGNAQFGHATADLTLTLAKASQTIAWDSPTTNQLLRVNQPVPLVATASSGMPVTFRVQSGQAVIANGAVTATNLGTVVLVAEQAGNDQFLPVAEERTISVASECYPDLPLPQITNVRIVGGTVEFDVANGAAYPKELFQPSPNLPPCGLNTNSSRSWVSITDGEGKGLGGFCALRADNPVTFMRKLWFGIPATGLPQEFKVSIRDRLCEQTWTSGAFPLSTLVSTVQFATNKLTVSELEGGLSLPILRTGGTNALTLGVVYGGNAVTNVDFRGGVATVSGGQATGFLSLRILDDPVVDGSRTLTVTLTPVAQPDVVVGANATLTITIEDNDTAAGPGLGFDGGVRTITALPDGRVLVAGDFESVHGVRRPRLARLQPDLTLDTNFVPASYVGSSSSVTQTALQPDGGILVRGGFPSAQGKSNRLRRLLSDGADDPNFAYSDSANVAFNILADGAGRGLAIGSFDTGSQFGSPEVRSPARPIIRLLPDGSRDPEFTAIFSRDPVGAGANVVAQLWDGRIVIGGGFGNSATATNRGRIARLLPDGSFDHSFKTGAGFHNGNNRGGSVKILVPDRRGRVLVAGDFTRFGIITQFQTNVLPGWARLLADGSLDRSFAPTNQGAGVIAAAVLDNNHIVALRSGGSLEEFDETGGLVSVLGTGINSFAVEPSGTVLAGGTAGTALKRINPTVLPESAQVGFVLGTRLVSEASSEVTVAVARTGPEATPIEVRFRVSADTAQAGTDFVAREEVLQIPSGERVGFITVPLSAQNAQPNDSRTLQVELLSVSGASLLEGRTRCVVTLDDDDTGLIGEVFAGTIGLSSGSDILRTSQPYFSRRVDTRQEAAIHFEWNYGAPRGVADNYFTVLWSGWLVPEVSGTYRLGTVADDGTRIWLDDRLVLTNFIGSVTTLKQTSPIGLEAGRPYRLTVHYFDSINEAVCRLVWQPPGATNFVTVPRSVLRPAGPRRTAPTVDLAWLGDSVQQWQITYTAEPGRPIHIQSSTNGVDWRILSEAVSAAPDTPRSFFLFPNSRELPAGGWLRAISVDGVASTNLHRLPLVVRIFQTATNLALGRTNAITLSASANGDEGQTFTWLRNGQAVATGSTLVVNGTQPEAAGTYQVEVSSSLGRALSAVRRVNFLDPPLITAPLADTQVWSAEVTSLAAGVAGLDLSYRWFKDGTPLGGQTNANLAFNPATLTNTGRYLVIVTNLAGAVTNGPADVRVLAVPQWAGNLPPLTRVAVGGSVTFSAKATGSAPLFYQWRLNGVGLAGATNAELTLPSVAVADAGSYTVVVANDAGSIESSPALLELAGLPALALVDNFADRWRFVDASFVGTTNNLAATGEAGEPKHADKVGGKSLWLTWRAPASGVATFRTVGSSFDTLLAVYTGNALNQLAEVASDEDRGGFLTSELRFNAEAGTEYQVAVAGFAGASGTVVLGWELDVVAPVLPVIAAAGQPADVLARAGQPVNFGVTAGAGGVGYQWSFNGQPLAGATGATLNLPAVTPAQAGRYRVRITTPGGAFVDSRDALLEVAEATAANLGALSAEKLADLFADDPAEAGAGRAGQPGRHGFTSLSVGVPGTRFLNLAGSLSEPTDPVPCDVLVAASRWLRFRTTTPGTVIRVVTTNAAFDTVLAVFTNRFAPKLVACNDDYRGPQSRVDFMAEAGVDYLVMVATKSGASGVCGVTWLAADGVTADEQPGLDATGLEDGHFTFRRVVRPGFYQLDRGATLDTLSPSQRLRVRSGLLDYRDPEPASGEARFYRFNPAQ
jgi:uncharacterized delta-60 repeat protein